MWPCGARTSGSNRLCKWVMAGLASIAMSAMASAQSQPGRPNSRCTGPGCGAMSYADLFIASFGASGSSQSLRAPLREQEEKVKNAFYGIDATRMQVETGRLTPGEGEFIADGHRQVIRDYIDSLGTEAKLLAISGRASDVPSLTRLLSGLLTIARHDALVGREELAAKAMDTMIYTLNTFSQQFAATCDGQSFPEELPFQLERQLLMLGTGTSVLHCARRKAVADVSSQGVNYHLETCTEAGLSRRARSLLGLDGEQWTLEISGRVAGNGTASNLHGGLPIRPLLQGRWQAAVVWRGQKLQPEGNMEIIEEIIADEERPAAVPNDAGPLARPNLRPPAPVPVPNSTLPKSRTLQKLRITTIRLDGGGFYTLGPWAESEIKMQPVDRPCK